MARLRAEHRDSIVVDRRTGSEVGAAGFLEGLQSSEVFGVRVPARPSADARSHPAPTLEFVIGDITTEVADAIVNPAGPGMVDLAIRRAAGPELLEAFHRASRRLPDGRLLPGQAILTAGFDLGPTNVVHCGPPFYADNPEGARVDLIACHVEALKLARARGMNSIAFPAIATGVHRYPLHEAAEVAVSTVIAELHAYAEPSVVRFVLYDASVFEAYWGVAQARLKAA